MGNPSVGHLAVSKSSAWLWSLAWLETQKVRMLPVGLCSHGHLSSDSLFMLKSESRSSFASLLLFHSLSWHKPKQGKQSLLLLICQGNVWPNTRLFVQQLSTKGMEIKVWGCFLLNKKKEKWLCVRRAGFVGVQLVRFHRAFCSEGSCAWGFGLHCHYLEVLIVLSLNWCL